MGRLVKAAPDPRHHIIMLSSIGYDLKSAIADIIDNSITAKARNIWIDAPVGLDSPIISIGDDGFGMDKKELLQNMIVGCKDPNEDRQPSDLGRFGSGMKTASFSQARKMTVITKKKESGIAGATWNLDIVESENEWLLEELSEKEILKLDLLKFEDKETGTQVIWEDLRSYKQESHSDIEKQLAADMTVVGRHLSIHFHRFMQGREKINFFINGLKIIPMDPFMTTQPGYVEGPETVLRTTSGKISIKVHQIPHHSNIPRDEFEALGGALEISRKQGFYIYRANRLIIEGGWQGLAKNTQLGNLARVEVNIPVSMDQDWSTDVRKSSLQMPPKVKESLRNLIGKPLERSKKANIYRGKKDKANEFWNVVDNKRENLITYEIDPNNSNLLSLVKKSGKKNLSGFHQYLKDLSLNLPINHIYNTMSSRPKQIQQEEIDFKKFKAALAKAWKKEK